MSAEKDAEIARLRAEAERLAKENKTLKIEMESRAIAVDKLIEEHDHLIDFKNGLWHKAEQERDQARAETEALRRHQVASPKEKCENCDGRGGGYQGHGNWRECLDCGGTGTKKANHKWSEDGFCLNCKVGHIEARETEEKYCNGPGRGGGLKIGRAHV